jgi:3-oxoadipate CoA-transferase beta subunit
MINKVVDTLAAALAGIRDGATVLVGGFGGAGLPTELIHALIEQSARDLDLINAGKKTVTRLPGGAYFHHADSFAMVRGGRLDIAILGGYQVSAEGDLANWSLGQPGVAPGVGGAMDLAVGAKQIFVLMEHNNKDGAPKLVTRCTLPLTAPRVVTRVYTDLAVIEPGPEGFLVTAMVRGLAREELLRRGGAPLRFAAEVELLTAA